MQEAGGPALADPADTYTQQLFERHLGGPKPLPDALTVGDGSGTAAWREAEECRFKLARGRAFDYQGVPRAGSLLGLTHHPARLPPPAARRGAQQQPPAPTPAHATLWALVQPTPALGISTSVSAVDCVAGSGYAGWRQEAFADLTQRASLEYSLLGHPASGLAAELDVVATLPKLPLLPQLTAQHSVAVAEARPGLRHSSRLSMSLLRGAAVARAQLQEAESGDGAAANTLVLEVQGRSKRSRGLAGGVKLSPAASCAFHGSTTPSTSSSGAASDSDEEGRGGGKDGGGAGGAANRLPGLRLQVQPAAAASWADLSGRWRQPWGGRLESTIGYQAQQRRWDLQLRQRLGAGLTATGSLAWEGPAHLGSAASTVADDVQAGGRMAQQLRAHVRSYGAASKLRRAGLRLACRLPPPAGSKQRRQLQLESSYDAEAGVLAHGLKLQLHTRRGGAADHLQQQRRCDVGLQARPRQQQLDLTFDFFAPF